MGTRLRIVGIALVLTVWGLAALPLMAQSYTPERYFELLRSDVRTAKVEILTEALDLSDAEAAAFWPVYREYETELSNTLPAGTYHHHLTAQGLFEVSAGTHTFYMNAMRDYGVCYVTSRDLTLMYFPTAHGSVDLTD